MITYNNIITALNNFADNHFFIKAFSHGDADEMLLKKYQNFPLMHVLYTGSSYDGGQKNYSFEIYLVDLPDDMEQKSNYQKEVVSDAEQCAEDLLADLSNGFNIFDETFLFDTESASIAPVIEETSSVISGVVLSITISVPYQHDSCNAPLTGVTPPTPAVCLPADVENSDTTYSTQVNSGATLVLPDINVTEVDGTVGTSPSVIDVICVWASIAIKNSEDTTLATLATFPVGAETVLPDITVTDSDGTPSAYPSGKNYVCTPAVSPSGILYAQITPTQRTSYQTGDTGWALQNSKYDYTPPPYPSTIARIDISAQQSGVRGTPASGTSSTDSVYPTMMVANTSWGTKFRFVDDQGNPSDATVGSNIWAHVDWNGHSWTGCTNAGVVYDNLYGIWVDVDYLLDGALYSQNTTTGQSWSAWITHINGMTHKGSTKWLPYPVDMVGYTAMGARHRYSTWAKEFFNAQRSDNRFICLTGDTPTDSTANSLYLGDYSNSSLVVQRQTKSATTSFYQSITNVFVFRIERL